MIKKNIKYLQENNLLSMIVVKKDPDLKYNLFGLDPDRFLSYRVRIQEDMNRYTARNFEIKDFLAKNYPKISTLLCVFP